MKFVTERINDEETLFIPVLSYTAKHWVLNNVSFIYAYQPKTQIEYIIGINHNDTLVGQLPTIHPTDFVYNSKILKQTCLDAKILIWLQNIKLIRHPLPQVKNLDCFPITKLFYYVRAIKDEFLFAYNNFTQWSALTEYSKLQQNLSIIESNGLYTANGYEYSEYNLFTLTGRPSNSFNNINYAALNKANKSRERFISRFGNNGILVEFDLKAFHIYLLSRIVKYDWPTTDIYNYFGTLYGNGIDPKGETFKQIYGGIDEKYMSFEFFQKIDNLTDNLFQLYNENNLKSLLFERDMNIPDLNRNKVLNYILQNFETEFNALLIFEINAYLYTRESKLVLYTYDSFLIDLSKNDGKETLIGLKNIFKELPNTLKVGKNYNVIC